MKKATYFKGNKNLKYMKCTVTVKNSDHRFRAISALISAASPYFIGKINKRNFESETNSFCAIVNQTLEIFETPGKNKSHNNL